MIKTIIIIRVNYKIHPCFKQRDKNTPRVRHTLADNGKFFASFIPQDVHSRMFADMGCI